LRKKEKPNFIFWKPHYYCMQKITISKYIPEKSFETFLIVLGLFLIMAEFFTFNANFSFCGNTGCLPKIVHYLVVLAGIGLVFWGIILFNPAPEKKWLVKFE